MFIRGPAEDQKHGSCHILPQNLGNGGFGNLQWGVGVHAAPSRVMVCAPRAPMTSIFEGQPPKTRPVPIKTMGPIWVLLLMAEILHHLGCMKPYK